MVTLEGWTNIFTYVSKTFKDKAYLNDIIIFIYFHAFIYIGAFYLTILLLPHMNDKGRIINLSSIVHYLAKIKLGEIKNFTNNEYNYSHNGISYILSQLVNSLSNEYEFELNPNFPICKNNRRKNTLESFGEESYMGQESNLNYNSHNNFNFKYNAKSRKNSENSINKIIQNDKNEFKDYFKNVVNYDEINQFKTPFDNNDFKNPNILDEEFSNEFIKKY